MYQPKVVLITAETLYSLFLIRMQVSLTEILKGSLPTIQYTCKHKEGFDSRLQPNRCREESPQGRKESQTLSAGMLLTLGPQRTILRFTKQPRSRDTGREVPSVEYR